MYDFTNNKDLTNMTNDKLLEYLLKGEKSIFIGGEAKGICLVITDGEGKKPLIEEIKELEKK